MQETPAELRNAAARRLMARGRFREALDVLNEAIRIDPRYAESFDNRAAVFERLGMYPQADADRRKVVALGGVRRPPPPPPDERRRSFDRRAGPPDRAPQMPPPPPPAPGPEPDLVAELAEATQPEPQPAPEPVAAEETVITAEPETEQAAVSEAEPEDADGPAAPGHGRRRVVAPRYPAPPRPPGGGTAALRSLGTLLITMGLLTAAGIGIYLALTSIGGALNGSDSPAAPGGDGSATPAASAGASGAPTDRPEDIDEALGGDPLSFSSFQAAWQAKGITPTTGEAAGGMSGFGTTPVSVTLSRGGQTMEIALLFYDSPAGPAADFDLSPTAITPKTGRTTPAGSIGWYNANVVAVILDRTDALYADARDAFFGVSA